MVPPRPRAVQKTGPRSWQVVERGVTLGTIDKIGIDQFEACPKGQRSVVRSTKGQAVAAIFQASRTRPAAVSA